MDIEYRVLRSFFTVEEYHEVVYEFCADNFHHALAIFDQFIKRQAKEGFHKTLYNFVLERNSGWEAVMQG